MTELITCTRGKQLLDLRNKRKFDTTYSSSLGDSI